MNAGANFSLEKHWTMAGEENSVCLTMLVTAPCKSGGGCPEKQKVGTTRQCCLPFFLLESGKQGACHLFM